MSLISEQTKLVQQSVQTAQQSALGFADYVNSLFYGNEKNAIDAPSVVVVGAQSSGKSSVLNRLIGRTILPTSTGCCTRSPIVFSVRNIADRSRLTVETRDGEKTTQIFNGYIDDNDDDIIIEKLMEATEIIAPNGIITKTPIYVHLSYRNAPDISFVDLPGLITIARTDQGQNETTIKDIRTLNEDFIKKNYSIVLCVMEAKTDPETDIALALVKKMEKSKHLYTAIGVLTKPDLIKNQLSIKRVVDGNISMSLSLPHGYFVLNNISNNEEEYFSHFDKGDNELKYGSANLLSYVSKLLHDTIIIEMPVIRQSIQKLKRETNKKLTELGEDLTTPIAKMALLTKIIMQLIQMFEKSVNSDGIIPNTGAQLKQIFSTYQEDLRGLDIFGNLDDKYYNDMISSFESLRMQDTPDTVKILERCMTDETTDPMNGIVNVSMKCVRYVVDAITKNIYTFLEKSQYHNRYHRLFSEIKKFFSNYISENMISVNKIINTFTEMERAFINTNNEEFLKYLTTKMDKEILNKKIHDKPLESFFSYISAVNKIITADVSNQRILMLKNICMEYYRTVKEQIYGNVTKVIMLDIVNSIRKRLSTEEVFNNIPNDIFTDDPSVIEIRNNLKKILDIITNIEASEYFNLD